MKKYKYDIGSKIVVKPSGGFVAEIVGKVDSHYKVRLLFMHDRYIQLPVDYVDEQCEIYNENPQPAEVIPLTSEKEVLNVRVKQKQVIMDMLKQGPQTRETLADAISVFAEGKDIMKLKSHVSAVLGQLKNENVGLVTLERGKYIIDNTVNRSERPSLGELIVADKVSKVTLVSLLETSLKGGEKSIEELAEFIATSLPEKQLEIKKLKQYISVAIRSMQKRGINVVRCSRGHYKLESEVENGNG